MSVIRPKFFVGLSALSTFLGACGGESQDSIPRLMGNEATAAIVLGAYEAAGRGDEDRLSKLLLAGATYGMGPESRPIRLADLHLEEGCSVREIIGDSINTAVAKGTCIDPSNPQHSWPYESHFRFHQGKISRANRMSFEW